MSGKNQNGFTVIETVIFIAVSGLLFVGILASTGTAISNQRYIDSVRTTESFLQKQIDSTLNFANTRDGSQVCTNTGNISSGTQPAGTSNCYVLGKALHFTQGSSEVKVYNVIGTEPSTIVSNGAYSTLDDETAILDTYNPRAVIGVGVETYDAPWDAAFSGASQDQSGPAPATMNTLLLLRSPRSGGALIYTVNVAWHAPAPAPPPSSGVWPLVTATDTTRLQKKARLCMSSKDFTGSSNFKQILITGQGGQSAIEAKFDDIDTAECVAIP